jgi:glycosyltransferase involved in cell wall biosynthesis
VRVAVVVPALNAARTVGAVVRAVREQIGDVVVVDDGSRDDTAGAARAAGARVLVHETNRGKGAALRTAFTCLFAEGFDAIVSIDADGQHSASGVPRLLAEARRGADLVIGSRCHLFAHMGAVRRTSNRISSWWISRLAGASLGDVQCGFRLYTRPLFERLGLPEDRFEAESAVVVRAARCGFDVRSVIVPFGTVDGRGTSHYRPVADSVRIFHATLRARAEPVRLAPARVVSS